MRHMSTNKIGWCLLLMATLAGVYQTYAQTTRSAAVDFAFQQKVPDHVVEHSFERPAPFSTAARTVWRKKEFIFRFGVG